MLAGDAANALFKQISDIVSDALKDLEKKAETTLWRLWGDVKMYVYLAAGILFTILLIPAIIGSIITVLLVRALDRRQERKAALRLKHAK